ncbi:MAG: acyl-CoA dehydrogenase [Spirochaetae bacterium HGW-Spirochaetae-5]|nr:MAG: acyl-CoA dehydrogenase [Spirochaetae bacterium HGW-Spirochaetae-5]
MAEKFFSEKNLKFTLYDVHKVEDLLKHDRFGDYNRESFDMILDTAKNIGSGFMYPLYSEMDKNAPEYTGTTIKVNPAVRQYMNTSGEGGWINAMFPAEHGGQQMPLSLFNACMFIFASANYSLSVYPGLTTGAASLIYNYGSESLIKDYAEKMVTGKWQGTMALTEPEAGSSLSDVKTSAEPMPGGYFHIKGQKTFISAGDHDNADNIIHLMLARVKGAPAGVKGLSLFVVPKYRPADSGELEFNDVNCAGCYHKMGYRGAPIAQLSMGEVDDCRGYLVGEQNLGLTYMFRMMNEARINVGLGATAISSAAYYASLEYTRERLQGRKIDEKNPLNTQIPIIEHADIKRMLLQQRAIFEGSLSLMVYAGKLVDLTTVTEGEEREIYELLLDFLTPIVKTYPSEMGITSTSQAIQCLGGYGYSSEFPVEQYMRDVRIHPIHEGTTGIQGMDLLGRKVTMKKGAAVKIFLEEIQNAIDEAAGISGMESSASDLANAAALWKDTTYSLLGIAAKGEIDLFLADATLYLELSGILCIAWQWLLQGIALSKTDSGENSDSDKNFSKGKMFTLNYFYQYELPKIHGLALRLKNSDGLTLKMKPEFFED